MYAVDGWGSRGTDVIVNSNRMSAIVGLGLPVKGGAIGVSA